MIDVVLLAIALSMDAFAVSIGLGSTSVLNRLGLAFKAGCYFGLFQAIMPLIGYLGGNEMLGWIGDYAPWVGFLLLVLIGAKMIYEAFKTDTTADLIEVNHRVMFMLAIATSIDALAAGFTLNLLPASPWLSCVLIGVMTFGFSFLGVLLGAKGGAWLERKATLFGGVVLVLIGVNILWSGLG